MISVADEDLPLERVYRWEKERRQRIFLTQPRGGAVRDWTWEKAVGEARSIATYLKAQNWEPGSRVAILSRNCAWWAMADLAIWMSGHVTVPVFPSLRAESIRYILQHSGARACFIGATDEGRAVGSAIPPGVRCISLPTGPDGGEPGWDALVAATPPLTASPVRAAGDVATIIYTSGTTGTPKGVIHSFGTLTYDAKALTGVLGLHPEDRLLSYLPLAHIFERAAMEATALHAGFRVFFSESVDTFLADLQRARPTVFLSVPRLLLKLQQGVFAKVPPEKLGRMLRIPIVKRLAGRRVLRRLGFDRVRYAASGAAPLASELLSWYRNLGLELAEGYGMTEILITHLGRRGNVRAGCVGFPVQGVETKLGANSELLVRSPMNMLGYYKDPEGTRDAFTEDGFFKTGDVTVIEPDGQLRIIGRVKEQFKTSKGKYVAPAPIENNLIAHPAVEACCLMGAGMASPFAIVVLSPEARKRCADPAARGSLEQSLAVLLAQVNGRLDQHERVSFLAIVDGPWTVENGLITPTLKMKRSALEARYQELIASWERNERPVVWESVP